MNGCKCAGRGSPLCGSRSLRDPKRKRTAGRILIDLESYLEAMVSESLLFIENDARRVMREHPSAVEFVMAMGAAIFVMKDGRAVGVLDDDAPVYIRKSGVARVIDAWDETLRLTGEPMRFTATSKVTREW